MIPTETEVEQATATTTAMDGVSICSVRGIPGALAFVVIFKAGGVILRMGGPGIEQSPDDDLCFIGQEAINLWKRVVQRAHEIALSQAGGAEGWHAILKAMGLESP